MSEELLDLVVICATGCKICEAMTLLLFSFVGGEFLKGLIKSAIDADHLYAASTTVLES